jgi:hypothetical protein
MTSKRKKPSDVLEILLAGKTSALQRRKLLLINSICDARFQAGEQDFSVATIGRLCEEQRILKSRGIFSQACKLYRDLIGAWSIYVDPISAEELKLLPNKHPEVVLRNFLATDARSDKKRNLRAINDICRKQHASGSLDFSFATIGQLCENNGILKRNSLSSRYFEDHRKLILAWDTFARPWVKDERCGTAAPKRVQKAHDLELTWVARDFPELEAWRTLAVEWIKGEKSGLGHRMAALIAFFDTYLAHPEVPKQPKDMLLRGVQLPSFKEIACPASKTSISYNNCIHEMIQWVLVKDFSLLADDGVRVISPAFRNPVPHLRTPSGTYTPFESVRSPLPYGYIDELRNILASGLHFRDWSFAQQALGADIGERGAPGRDWFDVTEELVDRSDPDCVFRVRPPSKNNNYKNVLQMWSPVRWVALMAKLLLPVRTTQIRLVDSGEFDTFTFAKGVWSLNENAQNVNGQRGQRRQGVFRQARDQLHSLKDEVVLYINTNKTADIKKDGSNRGYIVPWHVSPDLIQDVYYWLEKMRDWQSKYNPITRTTSWTELDGRHIAAKSKEQLAGYPDACFLFRMPEGDVGEQHLPISDGVLSSAWCKLLSELERRIAARGEKHADGSPIRLAFDYGSGRLGTPFPLHSLRVSLVTALALDGHVPFAILQKLVGHSRLLMTLYYTKPGATKIKAVLTEAAEKISLTKERTVSEFLLNEEHTKLIESAVCNNQAALAASIPEHPSSRNAAGWMLLHHGLCLVGGNTSELEDNNKIGGCYNGGTNLGSESSPQFGPVPGGSRNCIRCRWFVTEPHYLPALAAHFNTLAYHFDEARNKSIVAEQELQDLKRQKARMEASPDGPLFMRHKELLQVERLWEGAIKRFSDLAEDLVACWRLIERCQALLNSPAGSSQQLLVQGTLDQVEAVFEETESELLQLSGVCESLELYPDLEADKAVIRRSQLLDAALYNEGLPPVFMQLSEKEQLLAGNAFMRRLAMAVNSENPALAHRQVIAIIDAGELLGEHLGVDIDETFVPALRNGKKRRLLMPITGTSSDAII